MNEVLILALSVTAAVALIALGGGLVLDTAKVAWQLAEHRALHVYPTVYVTDDGKVWLCFNGTRRPIAAYNATDGKPLNIHHGCYAGPGATCEHRKRPPKYIVYCSAWIGPLRPGDAVTYVMQGQAASKAIKLQINSISVSPK